ncbi:MAG TPA: hypothetical protein VFP69_16620 [Streptomyces sp.]|nr:hypothetical protein [Streptomyces sp.]
MKESSRQAAARRAMEQAPPPVPPELYPESLRLGRRVLRRRALAHRLLWLVLAAAAVAFLVWATVAEPWVEPPSDTTPPLTGW